MEVNKRQKEQFVIYLKAIACILITNSHCSNIYPISFLAVGGSFGNAIFFALSGYCLARIALPFGKWIKKRIVRLIPALILILLISANVIEKWEYLFSLPVSQIIHFYINKYWFVFAILLYYPIFYIIFHSGEKAKRCLQIYIIGYVIYYLFFLNTNVFSVELEGFSPFKVYFYFGIFVLGGILYQDQEKVKQSMRKYQKILIFLLFMAAFMWGGIYGSILVLKKMYKYQFLIHSSIFLFTLILMILMILNSQKINTFNITNNVVKRAINMISESTLEIYLVQVTFLEKIETLSFPLSFVVFVFCAFGGGIVFHNFLDYLIRKIKALGEKKIENEKK